MSDRGFGKDLKKKAKSKVFVIVLSGFVKLFWDYSFIIGKVAFYLLSDFYKDFIHLKLSF